MKLISDVMTRGVRTLAPTDSVQLAAQAMDELDVGAVPVCDGARLLGMLTDRDIVLRGVAQGLPANQTSVQQLMSRNVEWCFETQAVDEVAAKMERAQIRRLPVVDAEKRLVGIVALSDMANRGEEHRAAGVLRGVSRSGPPHGLQG